MTKRSNGKRKAAEARLHREKSEAFAAFLAAHENAGKRRFALWKFRLAALLLKHFPEFFERTPKAAGFYRGNANQAHVRRKLGEIEGQPIELHRIPDPPQKSAWESFELPAKASAEEDDEGIPGHLETFVWDTEEKRAYANELSLRWGAQVRYLAREANTSLRAAAPVVLDEELAQRGLHCPASRTARELAEALLEASRSRRLQHISAGSRANCRCSLKVSARILKERQSRHTAYRKGMIEAMRKAATGPF
ncbi:hypothetical protein [Elioraea rosea]|uniref:hypothetical protein n=1 Tax=Elioraea rosea TaxID=2492390 RepID=UPI00118277F5|nr:hypothetical protein [Elioraea rosea]